MRLHHTTAIVLTAAAAVVAGCGSTATSSSTSPDEAAHQLARIVHQRVEDHGSTGIVAGIVFPDGSTRVVASGTDERGRRLNARSVFEIGSITKTFTATLLADAARRGEVRLTEPVERLLPGNTVPSRHGRQITLEDLATHRSALPRDATNLHTADPDNPYADYSAARLYRFLARYTLTRAPGATFEYSNVGMALLGNALARRAHMSYDALVRRRVLGPLGMTSTGVKIPAIAGHDEDGRPVRPMLFRTGAGEGALHSSMRDMLRYAAANLRDGGPLGPTLAAARAPRMATDVDGQRIGFNWLTSTFGERQITWHNGTTNGFQTYIGLDKASHTAVVVLSDSTQEPVDDIALHLLDPDQQLTPVHHWIPRSPAQLHPYVGVYDVPGTKVTIRRTPRGLTGELPGKGTARLFAETPSRFFLKVIHLKVSFQRDSTGRVTGLALEDHGRMTMGVKELARVEQPAAVLNRYVGDYEVAGQTATLTRTPSGLKAHIPGQPAVALYPESATRFFATTVNAQIRFTLDGTGAVTGGFLEQDGQALPASKVG